MKFWLNKASIYRKGASVTDGAINVFGKHIDRRNQCLLGDGSAVILSP